MSTQRKLGAFAIFGGVIMAFTYERPPKLIFMYGPPAAGKTTFSKNYCRETPGIVRISADEIRDVLYGSQDIYGNSERIYRALLHRMKSALLDGFDVIYDATNLRLDYRMDYLNDLRDIPCRKEIWCLYVDEDVARQRHQTRGRNIPWDNLKAYFDIQNSQTGSINDSIQTLFCCFYFAVS